MKGLTLPRHAASTGQSTICTKLEQILHPLPTCGEAANAWARLMPMSSCCRP